MLYTLYYQVILTKFDLLKLVNKLHLSKHYAFSIQTDSNSLNISSLSFIFDMNKIAYIPLIDPDFNLLQELTLYEILINIKLILINTKIQKISHNVKLLYNLMLKHNIEFKSIVIFDVTLESYVLNSILGSGKHDIISLIKQHLNYIIIILKNIKTKEIKQLKYSENIFHKPLISAIKEVYAVSFLHNLFWFQLKNLPQLKKVFLNIEIPLIPILARMEYTGVLIDSIKMEIFSKKIEKKIIKNKIKSYYIVGKKFNLSSNKELQNILFQQLKFSIIKKTPLGKPSTSEEVLKKLSINHVLPKIILQYRNLLKLKSNYTDKLLIMINPKTKRIHTSYQQTTTTTGRLSSRNPNLQNIPIRNNKDYLIRQAFIPRDGYKIVVADYSQIELRIIAHCSKDKRLLEAFTQNEDIHKITATEIFNIDLNNVTTEQRYIAKIINFGLIYGMNSFGLSNKLHITLKKAENYINQYFKRYPNVLEYIKNIHKQASQVGYIETLYGRRLYLPNINSNNIKLCQASKREAINAIIQGTAADLMKKIMISLDQWIKIVQPNVYMLIQVHDELIFEIQESVITESINKIYELMQKNTKLIVPLKINIGIGKNWYEASVNKEIF